MTAKKAVKRKTPAKIKKTGLHGIGLGNVKKVTQKEVMNMVKTAGAIVLGYAGGKLGGKMVKKAVINSGDVEAFKKWLVPLAQLGGGFFISAAGKGNSFVKVLGTGVMAAGVVEAVETAAGKSLEELIGADDEVTIQGLGEAVEDVNFDLDLPVLNAVGDNNYQEDYYPQENFNGVDDDDEDDDEFIAM